LSIFLKIFDLKKYETCTRPNRTASVRAGRPHRGRVLSHLHPTLTNTIFSYMLWSNISRTLKI